MARQPNDTTAIGTWNVTRPNQQRNAKYGDRWPMMPPNYADGYVSRTTGLTSGDSNPQYTGINNWGGFYVSQNYYHALCIRCTSHDWELEGWMTGNSNINSGLIYYDFKVWEDQYVNDPSKEISSYNNNGAYWTPNNGTPSQQAYISAWGATRLTQNTWYTLGMAYTQTSNQSWHAYPAYYLDGGGYGTSITSTSMTSTASNAGGTTTITSDWEWANPLGLHTSSGYFISDMGLTNINNGMFVTTHVKVFQ